MGERASPADSGEVVETIRDALARGRSLEVVGGASKRALGRPVEAEDCLSLVGFMGLVDYEPSEMVFSAKPATTIEQIEAVLADGGQQLAFEPPDLGPLYGEAHGRSTLGGIVACNLSGPRRIKAFAARDHVLGVEGVTGRGDAIKAGGRVVKNVTGYDLCKLLAGSYGTLAALTKLTVRALPAPERTRTVLVFGLSDERGLEALRAALATPYEVSAAAHLPAALGERSDVDYVSGAKAPVTAVRVEGFGPSVEARCDSLRDALGAFGPVEELHSRNSAAFWREVRDALPFAAEREAIVWRLSVTPDRGASCVAGIAAAGLDPLAYYDWGGGLIWLSLSDSADGGAAVVRAAAEAAGGHALLIRAPAALRARVPVFHPQPAALARLSARVKQSFDPKGVLNPGRMVEGV